MHVTDFTYELPENLISTHPPSKRGNSRLLVLDRASGAITHDKYSNLYRYLNSGDLVIRNNTQVIKARLRCTNENGSNREILLLETHAFTDDNRRRVLYRGTLRAQDKLHIGPYILNVEEVFDGGEAMVYSESPIAQIAKEHGEIPLPPYMHREATPEDTERYQTIFATKAGSVAAPTASLNFTKDLEQKLQKKSVQISELTLHVGLGTFLPIRVESLEKHKMHSEYFVVPKSTISAIRSTKNRGKKVLSVGTTVTRTLEYCAQQDLFQYANEASGEADIFIYPGYEFKSVDMMLTNFHAPKSTVLMMAAAFAGWNNLKRAYDEAIKEKYAFLSYGDSMLII